LKTSPVDDINSQFPGVFFTFITKDNIEKEELYHNNTILIFSKKLLEQENYHINLNDYNGFINEKNTFFPWELDKAIKKYKTILKKDVNYVGNEVVFHDPIPMIYLCVVIMNKSISNEIKDKNNLTTTMNLLLPKYEIYNDQPPDMTKLPFYSMPLEDNFSGFNKYKLSSKKFYQKMATLANVNPKQSREKIRGAEISYLSTSYDDYYSKFNLSQIYQNTPIHSTQQGIYFSDRFNVYSGMNPKLMFEVIEEYEY
jgi:hypothetical protein